MSNDKYRKAYNMVIEYEKEAHRKNQKRIAVGLKLIIIIPLIFLALLFFTGSSKVIFLILWIVSLFILAAYLITVEYMDYNLMYLRSQQNLANDKLKANGYLFLSDVYDQLGIKRTKMSQTVGWIYKPEGNENGDNFVDFGILETNRETEDGGYEKAILMEFNVDGPILDLI